ncbi:MAG: purine-nucleoside phosphorylase [Chloroflexi bacterium]|nr:purine-nucleoside phosphorylase [Chloroflexota bacterium]
MVSNQLRDAFAEACAFIRGLYTAAPQVACILGSGLSGFADQVEDAQVIPYDEIPHFPRLTVPGHQGRLVLGHIHRVPVAILQGRAHFYEGYDLRELTLPVRVLRALGAHSLVVTNAAGSLHTDWSVGDLMLITDHLNMPGLAGHNPLRGPNDDALGERFPAMSDAYDVQYRRIVCELASEQQLTLRQGVYAMVGGPNFETPAEIRALRILGADAVGMSTVPEVLVARHGGMRVLGLSMLSNICVDAVDSKMPPANHAEVLASGKLAAEKLSRLLEGFFAQLQERTFNG